MLRLGMQSTQQDKYIASMAGGWVLLMGCNISTQASDIDIYKSASKGEVVITMMLDTSGSMDLIASSTDYPLTREGWAASPSQLANRVLPCDLPKNELLKDGSLQLNQPHPDPRRKYRINYCMAQSGKKYLDRMSRLKDALYTLATSNAIDPNIKIGIGTYPYYDARTRLLDDSRKETNRRAYMRISAEAWGPVGSVQRAKVLSLIERDLSGNGGTPTAAAYAEAAAYMLGTTTGDSNYSGIHFADSKYSSNITQGSAWSKRYISPLSASSSPECNGQGIYFLTDGVPQSSRNSLEPTLMSAALQTYEDYVRRGSQGIRLSGGISDRDSKFKSSWKEIGFFARELNNSTQLKRLFRYPSEFRIRTAVVGFGSEFDLNPKIKQLLSDPKTQRSRYYYNCNAIRNVDARHACNWGEKSTFADGSPSIPGVGGYGEGGFYSAQSTDELIQSIVKFVEETKPDFDPLIMGSPTIPLDRLNPIQLHPFGYYATFIPKPASGEQLWQGNLNKYPIHNGELMDAAQRKSLIKTNGEIDQTAHGFWGQGGMKALIPLGRRPTQSSNLLMDSRTLWTNRQLGSSQQGAHGAATLQAINLATVLGIGADKTLLNDPNKNYWLNLLGYPVALDADIGQVAQLPVQELRQMGAVLHSKPILLTQQGKVTYVDGKLSTQDREDYLLFGSTQGLVHVVDQAGKEVFAFVPNEMLETQKQAFLAQGSSTAGKAQLFYGVDATWTAHTQYMSRADGRLSVFDPQRTTPDSAQGADQLRTQGMQWVYGGLRMGGQSYYALDLTDIHQPKFKFQIDPRHARIINTAGEIQVPELKHMGQSWSKPTLAYVNWRGHKKLVMLVGGGYDATGPVQCPNLSASERSIASPQPSQQQQPQQPSSQRPSPSSPQQQQGSQRQSPQSWQQQQQGSQRQPQSSQQQQWSQRQPQSRPLQQPQVLQRSGPAKPHLDRDRSDEEEIEYTGRDPQALQPKRRQSSPARAPDAEEHSGFDPALDLRATGTAAQIPLSAQARRFETSTQHTAFARVENKGYECPSYQQSNGVGAGVYMFDANDGRLLWWSSAHAQDSVAEIQSSAQADLKYSVVSQINAIDRNHDGLVDTLYFADLAGQAFRVDIDSAAHATNNSSTQPNFAKRVVRLLNLHQEDGLSPRFYGMPSFSVHQDARGRLFAAVALSSGNLSSPLVDASQSAQDGVFVLFDRDVARSDLYRTPKLQPTLSFSQLPLLKLSARPVNWAGQQSGQDNINSGWWSPFSAMPGEFKGLNEIFAIDHVLYANVYHKNGAGIGGGCGARVVGDSYLFQYCLPFGRCNTPLMLAGQANRMKIGAGILGTGLAKGYTNAAGSLSVALNRQGKNSSNCRSEAFKHLPECQLFATQVTIKSMRWYERRSKI